MELYSRSGYFILVYLNLGSPVALELCKVQHFVIMEKKNKPQYFGDSWGHHYQCAAAIRFVSTSNMSLVLPLFHTKWAIHPVDKSLPSGQRFTGARPHLHLVAPGGQILFSDLLSCFNIIAVNCSVVMSDYFLLWDLPQIKK